MRAVVFALASLPLIAACDGGADQITNADAGPPPPLPWAREALPPPPIPADNPQSDAKVELGWLLFHDPILSSDHTVACVTCHGQIWGLADGIPLGVGIGGIGPAGTGRSGPTHTRRNSQAIWNSAYRSVLFWDGRAASLEAQVYGPLENVVELGVDPEVAAAALLEIPEYVTRFHDAFPGEPQPVTADNLAKAIAAFERTLISDRSGYDAYVRGDAGALSPSATRGMFLFAEVGCATCHVPPLFGSDQFADIHAPDPADVTDHGRAEVTQLAADEHAFRVPYLRNARVSGPYFHAGTEPSLEKACDHASNRALSASDLSDLAEFIRKGLHDESRVPERALTVPSGLPVPLDGYSVPR